MRNKGVKKCLGSYISAMASGGLCSESLYLLPVQLSSSAVILGIGSIGSAPMLVEKCYLPSEVEARQSKH